MSNDPLHDVKLKSRKSASSGTSEDNVMETDVEPIIIYEQVEIPSQDHASAGDATEKSNMEGME